MAEFQIITDKSKPMSYCLLAMKRQYRTILISYGRKSTEGYMLIVDGFFENGVFVPEKPITAITSRKRAVLNIDNTDETADEKNAKREKAYQHFSQYKGILPADFDSKKELSEYRDERYGNID